jgi:hypothetical protein
MSVFLKHLSLLGALSCFFSASIPPPCISWSSDRNLRPRSFPCADHLDVCSLW